MGMPLNYPQVLLGIRTIPNMITTACMLVSATSEHEQPSALFLAAKIGNTYGH